MLTVSVLWDIFMFVFFRIACFSDFFEREIKPTLSISKPEMMKKLLLLCICFSLTFTAFAQQGSAIYGLNFLNGQLSLADLDPATGSASIISPNPTSPDQFAAGVSDIDPVSDRYFYVRGNSLYTVSLSTGQVISSPALQSSGSNIVAPLTNIAFNWLNDTIYGLQFTTGALSLASVDPANGQVQVISSSPISADRFSQGDADIDPVNRRYFYVRDGNELITVNLNDGTALHRVRVNIPASYGGAAFMNITYNFIDGQIYGLLFQYGSGTVPCTGNLYLAKADPATGNFTVLSQNPVSNDCFQGGVADIDPIGGQYFYPRLTRGDQEIITVDTRTGSLISSKKVITSSTSQVYLTNIAYNELYNVAPNSIIPKRMGNDAGTMTLGSDPLVLNAWVGPDASYRWEDGSTNPMRTISQPGKYEVEIIRDGFIIKGEVEVGALTDVEAKSLNLGFSLYPNPARDWLFLDNTTEQRGSVIITDAQGRKIRSYTDIPAGISIAELPQGLYRLIVKTENARWSASFVKE